MVKLPAFYDAARVGVVRMEDAARAAAAGLAGAAAVRPASTDRFRIAAFGIDCQMTFCTPGGSLFVPGAVEDTRRTVEWLYRNADRVTDVVLSLDTHHVFQIFHPAFWVDASGAPPAPFTVITRADLEAGRYRVAPHVAAHADDARAYVRALEERGRYVLTIWPYHALEGGVQHAVEPALHEAAVYHSALRGGAIVFASKGRAALTENYSVLSPEVDVIGRARVGRFDDALYARLVAYDRVYVFGQAKSHCVASTLEDLRARLVADGRATDLGKIWILEDAMSPVPPPPLDPLPDALDFPRVAERTIARLRDAGMRVVRTTDPVELPAR